MTSSFLFVLALFSVCLAEVVDLTNENFDLETQSGTWFIKCGHCKRLAPTWEELGSALSGTPVRVAKLDATTNAAAAKRFNVRGYPTLLLYSKGQVLSYSGARDLESLKSWAVENKSFAATQEAKKFATVWLDQVKTHLTTNPEGTVVLFGLGFLGGMIFTIVFLGSSYTPPQPQRKLKPE